MPATVQKSAAPPPPGRWNPPIFLTLCEKWCKKKKCCPSSRGGALDTLRDWARGEGTKFLLNFCLWGAVPFSSFSFHPVIRPSPFAAPSSIAPGPTPRHTPECCGGFGRRLQSCAETNGWRPFVVLIPPPCPPTNERLLPTRKSVECDYEPK